MNLKEHAKEYILKNPNENGVYVDFTMGNGHDTEFLCGVAKNGKVYSFDVQPAALENTQKLLSEKGHTNFELILSGHQNVKEYVKEPIDGGMFNLGYLPGGDKRITTLRETTMPAVEAAIELLAPDGILCVAVYPGHAEGEAEGEMLTEYLSTLPRWHLCATKIKILNSPTSPYFIIIEKKAQEADKK